MDLILDSQKAVAPNRKPSKQRNKHIWNDEIDLAVRENKRALYNWKEGGKPSSGDLMKARKTSKKHLRKARRQEIAKQRDHNLQEIMNARSNDTKMFYKLVNTQRKMKKNLVTELNANGEIHSTKEDILRGWNDHFKDLATLDQGEVGNNLNERDFDVDIIEDICKQSATPIVFTTEEIRDAVKSLNTNKAPDIYGLTAEHIIHGGDTLISTITEVINNICKTATIPDALKHGILTPIFKNKGLPNDAKNYRGITVLPVIGKILEILLRQLIRDLIGILQNRLQRGFTPTVSPLYSALILLESISEALDQKSSIFIALLDAKSAFDVVNHNSLLRKLFLAGIGGTIWLLIRQLNLDALTSVKWEGMISKPFTVQQGVRQGGILSTDLYKLYVNDVLDQLENSGLGYCIGDIFCGAPTCADDIALVANHPVDLQSMISTVENYSIVEKYSLQPTKSVILKHAEKKLHSEFNFEIGHQTMSQPEAATHLGIKHNSDFKKSITTNIEENISKARRTMYSLMGAGLHGKNGLNPLTCLHIYQIYVLPVLTYGLEILLPDDRQLEPIEVFNKKSIKQILSIPSNTADSAVYALTGTIPLKGQIHKKALNIYNKICGLDDSVERDMAVRQLSLNGFSGSSWFSKIRNILALYSLPSAHDLLDNPSSKTQWKSDVKKAVEQKWIDQITSSIPLFKSLQNLTIDNFRLLQMHPSLASVGTSMQDISRLPTKLKILTGTLYLQTNKASFNQNLVDPTCLLCKLKPESLEHFLLDCSILQETRLPYLHELTQFLHSFRNCLKCSYSYPITVDTKFIVDPSSSLCACGCKCGCRSNCFKAEYIARKLCFALHTQRNNVLNSLPSNKRKGL